MARSRIVSYEPEVDADHLFPHDLNARIHPARQQQMLRGSLDELGWIDAVKVNIRTNTIVDGHLRVAEAQAAGEGTMVPVLYLDLDEEEERKALATFDPITNQAGLDKSVYADLVRGLDWGSEALATLVTETLHDGPIGASEEGEPPEPADHPVTWGFVAWDKARRIDCSESEVTSLDAAYVMYCERYEGDDTGFIRWLVDGDRT